LYVNFGRSSFTKLTPVFSLTDNINEKDPVWRDSGRTFVDSVTKLLERLLDYRDVLKVRSFFVPTEKSEVSFLKGLGASSRLCAASAVLGASVS
jgi:hypothetical protein